MDVAVLDSLRLTIPYPSYLPRARGIHAVGKFGTLLKAKCTLEEKDLVQQAATQAGVTPSEFIRWCSCWCAREVLKDVPDARQD